MDEARQRSEVDRLLREISRERDRLLGDVPAIPPFGRASLNGVLTREFPVEAASRKAAAERDRLLTGDQLKIPHTVERALQSVLADFEGQQASRGVWSSDWRTYFAGWLRLFQWPARAALVAACLMTAVGILFVGKREAPSHRAAGFENIVQSHPSDSDSQSARAQFNLRVSTAELASLRASFLALDRSDFRDVAEEQIGMRLDLPVRPILIDGSIARMP